MNHTPPLLIFLAKVSLRAARWVVFLKAAIRHPASQVKRRAFQKRTNEFLEEDLLFEKWIHPAHAKTEDYCVSFSKLTPIEGDARRRKLQIAVVCHIYYLDTIEELKGYMGSISQNFDIFISTDSMEKKIYIESLFQLRFASSLTVQVMPNIGRDIAAKLVGFKEALKDYDLLLFIHGKKSASASELEGWRKHLCENLLGTQALARSIITAFEEIPNLGMIAPQHFKALKCVGWKNNKRIADGLCRRMLGDSFVFNYLDFPSGSMFWCRPTALLPLITLDLSWDDFPPEQGQLDGTLAHAIERLFFVSCELSGLDWFKVAGEESAILPSRLIRIETVDQLKNLLDRRGRRILTPRRAGVQSRIARLT
jgi:O-antigen biosynthesis protein